MIHQVVPCKDESSLLGFFSVFQNIQQEALRVLALPWFEGHVTCASLPSQLLQRRQAMLYFIAEGQCEVRMIRTG